MKLRNMTEAEAALHPFLEVAVQMAGKHVTLARTERLMAHIGHPERRLRVIHVAGTSGKTSTTYYITALLVAAGQKVGHTVSPHINTLAERVSINGKSLDEATFCAYLGEFLDLIETAPERPSWFECMIAFAYWVFVREKVDYVVMETGLGGLQDSTNVAERVDKVCVITDIGYDHMNVLGSELGRIAYQKAGIIHDGNTALMYEQDDEVMRIVRYWVSQHEDAELLTFSQDRLERAYGGEFAHNLPAFQRRNWLLAFAVYRFAAQRDELALLAAPALQRTQSTKVPGRMDSHSIAGKTIVFDGAHNQQKMHMFVDSFMQLYPDRNVPVLMALKQGKEAAAVATEIAHMASSVIVTTFDKGQDLPDTAMDPTEIARALDQAGVPDITVEPDTRAAFDLLISNTDDIGVVTGSFFLVSQLEQMHPRSARD